MILVLVLNQIRYFIASPTYIYPICRLLTFSDNPWASLGYMEVDGITDELLRNACPSEECRDLVISRFYGQLFRCTRL